MVQESKKINPEIFLLILLFLLFVITEIIDSTLDYLLGPSFFHTIIQLFLFLFLFLIIYRLFIYHTNKKIKKLVPEDLMEMLRIIKNEKNKGVMINQRKMREVLDITKPTLKKKVDALLELQYVTFEEKGNNRYFILTDLGESLVN